jgi:LysM repeat protein
VVSADRAVNQAAPTTTLPPTYTVRRGDSLYGIARRFGIRLDTLLALNALRVSSVIHPGDVLRLSGTPPTTQATTTTAATTTTRPTTVAPVTTYRVVRGDSLYSIARRFHIPLATLLALNGLRATSLIMPGRVLRVSGTPPTTTTSTTTAPATTTTVPFAGAFYTVVRGDSLYGIARRMGVPFNTLLALNCLTATSVIVPGQRLVVSRTGAVPGTWLYTVVRGDSLFAIARKTGTPLPRLLSLNCISSSALIVPGQQLRVLS